MSNTSVDVFINQEPFGTWTLDYSPTHDQRNEVRKAIRTKITELNKDESLEKIRDTITVVFSELIVCESLEELIQGITESIENNY